MNKTLIACGLAALAVFAGVMYFAREPAAPPAPAGAQAEAAAPEAAKPASAPPASRTDSPSRPVASDPRLAALMVSPDNALIEFFADPEGRVIKEIDNDPNSPGYKMPLREYTYAGDKVIRLVTYKHLGTQIQVTQADVVYKPDGSVAKYGESTSYRPGK